LLNFFEMSDEVLMPLPDLAVPRLSRHARTTLRTRKSDAAKPKVRSGFFGLQDPSRAAGILPWLINQIERAAEWATHLVQRDSPQSVPQHVAFH
jgi:hypothetical protein